MPKLNDYEKIALQLAGIDKASRDTALADRDYERINAIIASLAQITNYLFFEGAANFKRRLRTIEPQLKTDRENWGYKYLFDTLNSDDDCEIAISPAFLILLNDKSKELFAAIVDFELTTLHFDTRVTLETSAPRALAATSADDDTIDIQPTFYEKLIKELDEKINSHLSMCPTAVMARSEKQKILMEKHAAANPLQKIINHATKVKGTETPPADIYKAIVNSDQPEIKAALAILKAEGHETIVREPILFQTTIEQIERFIDRCAQDTPAVAQRIKSTSLTDKQAIIFEFIVQNSMHTSENASASAAASAALPEDNVTINKAVQRIKSELRALTNKLLRDFSSVAIGDDHNNPEAAQQAFAANWINIKGIWQQINASLEKETEQDEKATEQEIAQVKTIFDQEVAILHAQYANYYFSTFKPRFDALQEKAKEFSDELQKNLQIDFEQNHNDNATQQKYLQAIYDFMLQLHEATDDSLKDSLHLLLLNFFTNQLRKFVIEEFQYEARLKSRTTQAPVATQLLEMVVKNHQIIPTPFGLKKLTDARLALQLAKHCELFIVKSDSIEINPDTLVTIGTTLLGKRSGTILEPEALHSAAQPTILAKKLFGDFKRPEMDIKKWDLQALKEFSAIYKPFYALIIIAPQASELEKCQAYLELADCYMKQEMPATSKTDQAINAMRCLIAAEILSTQLMDDETSDIKIISDLHEKTTQAIVNLVQHVLYQEKIEDFDQTEVLESFKQSLLAIAPKQTTETDKPNDFTFAYFDVIDRLESSEDNFPHIERFACYERPQAHQAREHLQVHQTFARITMAYALCHYADLVLTFAREKQCQHPNRTTRRAKEYYRRAIESVPIDFPGTKAEIEQKLSGVTHETSPKLAALISSQTVNSPLHQGHASEADLAEKIVPYFNPSDSEENDEISADDATDTPQAASASPV